LLSVLEYYDLHNTCGIDAKSEPLVVKVASNVGLVASNENGDMSVFLKILSGGIFSSK
jgi:hypothetical protein